MRNRRTGAGQSGENQRGRTTSARVLALLAPVAWALPLLAGVGPPEIDLTPGSFTENLLTGETVTRRVTIENSGESDLSFAMAVRAALGATTAVRQPSRESPVAGARVLLVQDVAPWGTSSNVQILEALGIPFDTLTTSGLPSIDLATYRVVIVASDQLTSSYAALAAQESRIEAFVAGGGVLEFHAAGWGRNRGDSSLVTLPGGMHIRPHNSSFNYVLEPAHPLVAGVPNPFFGDAASHAHFSDVPAGAERIAFDQLGQPTLVVYPHGAGIVVAGGQTLEHGYAHGGDVGRILSNMIPYAYDLVPLWLSVDPASGVVPAGTTAEVAVTFDATGLLGGDYDSNIVVASNDPDEMVVGVPVHLHVTGVADIAISVDHLDYGQVYAGTATPRTLRVSNVGTDLLTVSSLVDGDGAYTVSDPSFMLAVGEDRDVVVTFSPAAPGSDPATLILASNDPDEPKVAVGLAGLAVLGPRIGVVPGALTVSVSEGGSDTRRLDIGNGGGSALDFELAVRGRLVACAEPTALVAVSSELSLVHLVTGAAVPIVSGLLTPMAVEHDPARNVAYVTEYSGGSLARIDLSTGALTRIAFSLAGPADLALSRDGRRAYVAESRELSEVDLATGAVVTVASNLAAPWGVALDGAGLLAYVSETSAGRLRSVDLTTGSVATIATGLRDPAGVTLNEAGTVVYVAEYRAGELSSVDLATGVVTTLASGLAGPTGVIVNAEESKAFVTEYASGEISTVDIESGVVTRTSSGLSSPRGIAQRLCGGRLLTVAPLSGTVLPRASAEVEALFDSLDLPGGSYDADILVSSNDPFRPLVTVPVTLEVIGTPNLILAGESVMLESVQDYTTNGAKTTHAWVLPALPGGAGAVEVLADGDYGDPSKTATLTAEGLLVGTVGPAATDCTPSSGFFPLAAEKLEELAADGTVLVEVRNSVDVHAFCETNRHTVRLRYERSLNPLDFGSTDTATRRTLTIHVRNAGSAVLLVDRIASDLPEFTPSPPALTVPPHAVRRLTLTFAPTNPGFYHGTLSLQSNDPDAPVVTIPLSGEARAGPDSTVLRDTECPGTSRPRFPGCSSWWRTCRE